MKKTLTKAELELKRRVKEAWTMLPKIDVKDCIALWQKVLYQMIADALSNNKSAKKKAIIWFKKDEKDFNFVCSYAQVAPQKLRQFVFNKLTEQDPEIIEKLLLEEPEKVSKRKTVLVNKLVKEIKITNQISFLYNNREVRAYIDNDELWFDLTHLNGIIKFLNTAKVCLLDLDTYVEACNLRKSQNKNCIIFANLKGIFQLSLSFSNENLKSFADWVEQGMYKYDILKGVNFFFLNFQDNNVLAWLHKKKLFFHFSDIDIFFPVLNQTTRREAQQKDKHFYVYLNSKKRQFMIRSDLLLQITKSKNVAKKVHQEIKPQLIQWIKEQQSIFEGENDEE